MGISMLLICFWFNFYGLTEYRKSPVYFRLSIFNKLMFLKYSFILFWLSLMSAVVLPSSSQSLLIRVLSFFCLVSHAKCLLILFIFSKHQVLDALILHIVSVSLISSNFWYFCQRVCFVLVFPNFWVASSSHLLLFLLIFWCRYLQLYYLMFHCYFC